VSGRALVTGGAGFIGSHLVDSLLADGWEVTVVDDFNDSYAPTAKRDNIRSHLDHKAYQLIECDIRAGAEWAPQARGDFDVLVHLAGRAGVRPSIAQPALYRDVNVHGTEQVLAFARAKGIQHFVFASSSSVYGVNPRTPWRERDTELRPISPYAETKIQGERMGFRESTRTDTGFVALRFFTVYGPRQRPDLAIHSFTRSILAGQPITVFGDGTTIRDYTYVSDIVAGIRAAIAYRGSKRSIFNLGNDRPVSIQHLIESLESLLGRRAQVEYKPIPPGDVPATWADITAARAALGYDPKVTLEEGLGLFADWLGAAKPRAAA